MSLLGHGLGSAELHDAAEPGDDVTSDDARPGGTDPPWEWVEALYLDLRDDLVVRLVYLLKSRHDAEDVAQEAFIQAMRKWHTLRSRDTRVVAAWLYRIAVRLALTRLRQRGRRREVGLNEVADYRVIRQLVSDFVSPEQTDDVSLALEMLSGLSDRQREVYLLYHYFGFGTKDIAHHLGLRAGTVRVHLSRAQQEIDRTLGHHGSGVGN